MKKKKKKLNTALRLMTSPSPSSFWCVKWSSSYVWASWSKRRETGLARRTGNWITFDTIVLRIWTVATAGRAIYKFFNSITAIRALEKLLNSILFFPANIEKKIKFRMDADMNKKYIRAINFCERFRRSISLVHHSDFGVTNMVNRLYLVWTWSYPPSFELPLLLRYGKGEGWWHDFFHFDLGVENGLNRLNTSLVLIVSTFIHLY